MDPQEAPGPRLLPPRAGPELGVALVGGLAWLLLPLLPLADGPGSGSVGHVFLLLPLVVAPVAVGLLDSLRGRSRPGDWARAIQPVGALSLLLSWTLPSGPLAAGLTLPWVGFGLLLLGAAVRPRSPGQPRVATASFAALHLFLLVGGGWLLMARLGVAPPGLPAPKVLLAAVHFHATGFALQLLFAASARILPRGSRRARLHRIAALGAIAGLVGIAAGNLAAIPALRLAAVFLVAGSSLALAATIGLAAAAVRHAGARLLLRVSALSCVAGMVLAGIYGVGEYHGVSAIGIAAMAVAHGGLHALGFVLCGLLGLRIALEA
jgi:hypothetical protein